MSDTSFLSGKMLLLLHAFAQAELARIGVTVGIGLIASLLLRYIRRQSLRQDAALSMNERRQRTVLARNLVILFSIGAIIAINKRRGVRATGH